jgi:DNA anti-recombination protein RmuC
MSNSIILKEILNKISDMLIRFDNIEKDIKEIKDDVKLLKDDVKLLKDDMEMY